MSTAPSNSKVLYFLFFMVLLCASCIAIHIYHRGLPEKQARLPEKQSRLPEKQSRVKRDAKPSVVVSKYETEQLALFTDASVKKINSIVKLLGDDSKPAPSGPRPSNNSSSQKDSKLAVSAVYIASRHQSGRGSSIVIKGLQDQGTSITLKGHSSVDQLLFARESRRVLLTDQKGELTLYELPSAKVLTRFSYKGKISVLAMSADASHIGISGRGNAITLIQPESNTNWQLPRSEPATALALSDDGIYFAVATKGQLRLYDTDRQTVKVRLNISSPIRALCFSPNNELVAASHADGTVRLIDTEYGEIIANLPQRNLVNALAFSPNSSLLATGGEDKLVKIYELASMSAIKSIQHPSAVISLAFASRGRTLISTSRSKAEITSL